MKQSISGTDVWARWITALTDAYEVSELEHFHRVTGEADEAARPGFFSRFFGSSQRRKEDVELEQDAHAYHQLTSEALTQLGGDRSNE